MGKLKIGRLYVRPVYMALFVLGLVLVAGGAMALLNNPAVWYDYGYSFQQADLEGLKYQDYGGNGLNVIGFKTVLAKGEVIKGRLVGDSGESFLMITAENEIQKSRRVVDSGLIQAGKSFNFSLVSNWTVTSYEAVFFFSGHDEARFYSNLAPTISGTKRVPLSEEEKSRIAEENKKVAEEMNAWLAEARRKLAEAGDNVTQPTLLEELYKIYSGSSDIEQRRRAGLVAPRPRSRTIAEFIEERHPTTDVVEPQPPPEFKDITVIFDAVKLK